MYFQKNTRILNYNRGCVLYNKSNNVVCRRASEREATSGAVGAAATKAERRASTWPVRSPIRQLTYFQHQGALTSTCTFCDLVRWWLVKVRVLGQTYLELRLELRLIFN